MNRVIRTLLTSRAPFDAAATAYFAATGITNPIYRAAINAYIVGLKNAGIFSKITARYLTFNNATTAAINLVSPTTFQGTIVNAPTINATGYTASATSYFRTGLTPSTHMSINDQSLGVYLIGTGGNNNVIAGSQNAGTTQWLTMRAGAVTTAGIEYVANNYTGRMVDTSINGKITSYLFGTRGASGASALYQNNVQKGPGGTQTGSLPNLEFLFDGNNVNGIFTAQGSNTRKYGMFHLGLNFTATDVANDYNLTTTLLQTLGLI